MEHAFLGQDEFYAAIGTILPMLAKGHSDRLNKVSKATGCDAKEITGACDVAGLSVSDLSKKDTKDHLLTMQAHHKHQFFALPLDTKYELFADAYAGYRELEQPERRELHACAEKFCHKWMYWGNQFLFKWSRDCYANGVLTGTRLVLCNILRQRMCLLDLNPDNLLCAATSCAEELDDECKTADTTIILFANAPSLFAKANAFHRDSGIFDVYQSVSPARRLNPEKVM